MRYLLLPLTAILFAIEWLLGIFFALVAILFAEVIALFVNKNGDLPWGLRQLFQPVDNKCWGDEEWSRDNPTYSTYRLCASYLRRNAAYGYQSLAEVPVSDNHFFGDLSIRDGIGGRDGWLFVVNSKGFWQLCFILNLGNGKCLRGDYGWSLVNASALLTGSLQLTFLFRFYNFTKA